MDSEDNVLAYDSKERCHQGNGILHRAFSIFLFNSKNELLVQQRSAKKTLWPLYWSNSVCSHPVKGETYQQAARRRLKEEIGVEAPLVYLFRFQYRAHYNNIGSEKELCSVYIGRTDAVISANQDEIAAWEFIKISKVKPVIEKQPHLFTPWFKAEWQMIKKFHLDTIKRLRH